MNEILDLYKVNFSSSVDFPKLNRISSINTTMSQLIGDHYRLSEVNRLLFGINAVLNNDIPIYDTYTQSLQILITDVSTTRIYIDLDDYEADNSIPPDFTLPTKDFKVIVEAWRDYLKNSPLKAGV
ncbi:hypothetical protein BEL04_11480 [Mucilaginibacter sp. PPCGB 2223]|uniref:hypothetical protein n=1 Tax=Mucilaginibacter sp. PPCGB 2223 TaxID=1886027 RepID=UPI000825DAAD|nr:hypothetical protein [Mucilaginibacter sp. PPCGB 2223]OCX52110.1 hypothetical protein BEL04_11480 [Mucilaginibacter sp. PPCGB 2223]